MLIQLGLVSHDLDVSLIILVHIMVTIYIKATALLGLRFLILFRLLRVKIGILGREVNMIINEGIWIIPLQVSILVFSINTLLRGVRASRLLELLPVVLLVSGYSRLVGLLL